MPGYIAHGCGSLLFVLIIAFSFSGFAQGQDVIADEIAPPPLRRLSPEEKSKLAAETEVKRRTKLTLDLMNLRLVQSENLAKAENYDQMFLELGGFHALMDNMLEFLDKGDKDSGRVLSNFKKFEIVLRGFTPRLEVLRRELPTRYEAYVRTLIKNLRAARAKAIEPLFDDSVVPTKKP